FAPLYDERACMLLVTADAALVLMPSLNARQASAEAPELGLVTWDDDEGPVDALRRTLEQVDGNGTVRAGVDPGLRAEHLLRLQEAIAGAGFASASLALRPLRELKSADELRLLEAAAEAADGAIRAAFAACRRGATELEVADAAAAAFRAAGCEQDVFTSRRATPRGAGRH